MTEQDVRNHLQQQYPAYQWHCLELAHISRHYDKSRLGFEGRRWQSKSQFVEIPLPLFDQPDNVLMGFLNELDLPLA